MSEELSKEEEVLIDSTYDVLNVILGCDVITIFNDKLVGTKAYRQKLKLHSKGLNEEAEKVLNDNLNKMFKIDENIYNNISSNLQSLIEVLSKNIMILKPHEILELNQVIQFYTKNKETFREMFDITLEEFNDGK